MRLKVEYFPIWLIVAPLLLVNCDNEQDLHDMTQNELPVIHWSAAWDNEMTFRYEMLENTESTILYTAVPDSGTFNHHNYITWHDGVLFALWDNHLRDENGSGQRTLMRRSIDQGVSWEPIVELFPSMDEMVPASVAKIGRRFHNLQGFAEVKGTLYAIIDVSDWGGTGPGWQERERVHQGRMARSISAGGEMGEIFWLTHGIPPEPVVGFSAYAAGDPGLVDRINTFLQMPQNQPQLDFTSGHPTSDDGHRMAEPTSPWRLDDGTMVRFYRDAGIRNPVDAEERERSRPRRNYAAFSFDDGKTWTTPTRTSYPDVTARTDVGTLPDGRVYVINNMIPLPNRLGGRQLLGISLSDDGLNFDRSALLHFLAPPRRYAGRAKAVGYQYPHSVVVENDIWVLLSVNKEDIMVIRIPINELDKLPYYKYYGYK